MYKFTSLDLAEPSKLIRKFMLITFFIIVVFVVLLFLPWQQTVQGVAKLTALNPSQRDYTIVATIDGFIEKFYVHENQFVHKGEKLFTMVDLDKKYAYRIENTQEQIRNKYENEKQKLGYLQKNLLNTQEILQDGVVIYERQIQQLQNKQEARLQEQYTTRNTLEIEKKNLQRYERLYKEGIKSQREYELQKNSFLQAVSQNKTLQSKINNLQKEHKILLQKKKQFAHKMQLQINGVKEKILNTNNMLSTFIQALNQNETLASRYKSRDIVAKSDGYVVRIFQNDINKLITRGEKILYFSPLVTQRALRVKVSDFHMPLMKKGLKTRIIFYGWPAMQISGWPKISHGTYGGVIHSIEKSAYEKNVYYVLVTQDPKDEPWPEAENLKIGTQATVWIRLGIVPIWYEIWRRMVAQPPKMMTAQHEDLERW
ncbi:HlyD family secretion protein [Sulfurimonas sp.]